MAGRLMEVVLRVQDLSRSVAFYRDLLGVPLEPGDPQGSHFEVAWGRWEAGACDLVMLFIYPADREHPQTRSRIGVSVDDLDAVHLAAVRAGVEVVESPRRRPWGMQAVYRDPDGNLVAVCQVPRG